MFEFSYRVKPWIGPICMWNCNPIHPPQRLRDWGSSAPRVPGPRRSMWTMPAWTSARLRASLVGARKAQARI